MFARLALLFVVASGAPRLVVNEIFYDPPGSDSGQEFVELMNAGGAPVTLDASWTLERGNGAVPGDWDVVWSGQGEVLEPGTFFVIGDHPSSDDVVTLALQNGPDACRLRANGVNADVVGWGAHEYPEYAEGAPADDPTFGLIARRVDGFDSDDNGLDFVAATRPTPGEVNFYDRDLAVERVFPVSEPALPEPSEPFRLRLLLRNVGRLPLDEGAVGVEAESRRVWLDASLPAGGVRDVTVLLSGRAAGTADVRVQTIGALDPSRARWVSLAVGSGAVRINEVMIAPDPPEPEWIEVVALNPTSLSGWHVLDAGGGAVLLSGSTNVSAPLVFTREPDRLLGVYPALSPAAVVRADIPTLNDSEEWLYVMRPDSTLSDAVPFTDAVHGRSLERLHPSLTGRDPAAFATAPGRATPGATNSVFARPPVVPELSASPRVVGSDGTTIRYHLGEDTGEVRVCVVDVTGRERARLLDGTGAPRGVLHWDGTRDGERLPPGLYVLVATLTRAGIVRHRRTPCVIGWTR